MTTLNLVPLMLVTGPRISQTELGTAQVMTFAIILGTFMVLSILMLFWLRSGHERARRRVMSRQLWDREQSRERARILEAHEPPPRHGEDLPR